MQQPLRIAAILLAIILVPLHPASAGGGEDYPLRPYYPEVLFIDTDSLIDIYDSVVVVDIRSSFEYDVARINKAVLLPLTDADFAEKLEAIRPKASLTPMAFYCNGHSCAKSYKAAQLAISLGFSNVYTYDGGIFDWIMAAPDKATLMGETPARADRIISDNEFADRLLNFDEFAKQAQGRNTIAIDIRDPFQREMIPRIPGVRSIPLDPLLDLVTSRIWTEKRLLFFDAVGKQVRWLQYFLESYGYFDYAFLDGGMHAIAEDNLEPVMEADRSVTSDQARLLAVTTDKRMDGTDRKVLNYLISRVKFNNYIVVSFADAASELGVNKDLLLRSAKKMSALKYLNYSVMQDSLIAQIDPLLAWKGKIRNKEWKDASAEFEKMVEK